jgi:hypothetical protein
MDTYSKIPVSIGKTKQFAWLQGEATNFIAVLNSHYHSSPSDEPINFAMVIPLTR